ncbi:hypothetical protein HYW20_02040 [Candidatus Woesearchaeota archaeon]|nr:hypothetical protein [Candidatus Woesearchaeota archaeon]
MVFFNLDEREQERLEEVVGKVISGARHYFQSRRDTLTTDPKNGNEQTNLDNVAKRIIFQNFENTSLFTEEGNKFLQQELSELVISDPVDGSSLVNLMGPYSSPTSTSLMKIRKNGEHWSVVAAVVGDLWRKQIYGIDGLGTYRHRFNNPHFGIDELGTYRHRFNNPNSDKKRYIHLESSGSEAISLAAYTQTSRRAEIAIEIYNLLQSGRIKKFINDGGGLHNLRVVSNSKDALSCAAELLPKQLYELTPVFLALNAGAKVSRMDGNELEVNPYIKQTAIVARNDNIREALIQMLQPSYARLGISHREEISIKE